MKLLIFIVAYHHWRVLVISYWLRGAADSLIACARAHMMIKREQMINLNVKCNDSF